MQYTNIINPPVFAHRGASQQAPENTFAAFLKAYALGIRWLEFDVMLSSDNEVVVIHDETLDRTTNGHGYVNDYSYELLKQLDAGSWFDPIFKNERIPLLKEVIDFLRKYNMGANIEIKAYPGKEKLAVEKIMNIVSSEWTSDMLPLLLSSFSLKTLEWIRYFSTECLLGLLMDEWLVDWKKLAKNLNCFSIHPNEKILTRERTQELKSHNYFVFSYTVDDMTRAQELFSWGVDAVYSNCPGMFITR